MESLNWDVLHDRFVSLMSHAQLLWIQSNFDRRLLLTVCGTIVIGCAYVAYRHIKWRFVNRDELRKLVHYAKIRKMLPDIAPFDDPPQVVHE